MLASFVLLGLAGAVALGGFAVTRWGLAAAIIESIRTRAVVTIAARVSHDCEPCDLFGRRLPDRWQSRCRADCCANNRSHNLQTAVCDGTRSSAIGEQPLADHSRHRPGDGGVWFVAACLTRYGLQQSLGRSSPVSLANVGSRPPSVVADRSERRRQRRGLRARWWCALVV